MGAGAGLPGTHFNMGAEITPRLPKKKPVKNIRCKSCGAEASNEDRCEYCGSFNSIVHRHHTDLSDLNVEELKHRITEAQDLMMIKDRRYMYDQR